MPNATQMSVPALERMLKRRRTQLKTLTRRRVALKRKLKHVERQIGNVVGTSGNGAPKAVKRKVRRRPKNAKSLSAVVVDTLKKNKGGLTLEQLASKVVASGYKSHSDDFKNVVYQCCYNNRKNIQRDAKSGLYKLSGRAAQAAGAEA